MAVKSSSEQIPAAVQQHYSALIALSDAYCSERLNDECAALCRKAAAALARKRPSPLVGGKLNTWACAIVYAVCQVNFLFDKSENPHTTADELSYAFDIARSTAGNKAKEVRDLLKMRQMDHKWMLPSKIAGNPLVWNIMVDGWIVDVRDRPREIQEEAFRKGYIPYIPDDHPPDRGASPPPKKPDELF